MQKDRNLVLYDGYNKPLWSSRTVVWLSKNKFNS
jgi:hypothetical protein